LVEQEHAWTRVKNMKGWEIKGIGGSSRGMYIRNIADIPELYAITGFGFGEGI
jgi:hypothetical protein